MRTLILMFVIGGDAPQAEFSDQAMQRLDCRLAAKARDI